MGFTNHLNYAYLHDVSQLEPYLLKMKEILESLLIYEQSYYAPGLPFVEEKISMQEFHVERKQMNNDLFVSVVTRIS